ncbi:MAG: hypothetical protein WDM78_08425 [Puia sp.]
MYDMEIISEASAISELKSVQQPEEFLQNLGIGAEETVEIKKCISAGHPIKTADTLVEKILSDALTFYFGSTAFKEYNNLLRREIEAFYKQKDQGRVNGEKTPLACWKAILFKLIIVRIC